MSLGTGDPASETGEDSLSAITLDSDFETKTKRKSVHKPPPTSPKSPYYCKPRTAACGQPLRTAASMPLGSRTALTPQRLWLGSAKQGHAPGTLVYREKEDMYDEIMDLKKSLHMQRSDADLLRTKLRRLEEENSRKDRQIEQLLDPSRGPDFVWTLGEKRPDAGWVINGLKQRVLRLEQQCKDKDSTISQLQTDMKTTSLEEMRVVMETYYEEIHRLQTLLASSEMPGRRPVVERKAGLRRQRRLSGALLSLSRSVQELTEENQSLKEDLDRVLSSSPTVAQTKGCMEWSKPRLLRRITELEKKISSMESPKPQASDVVRSDPLALSTSSTWGHRQPRPEPQEDSERPQDSERQEDSERLRLRGALRSLKGERKALQARLQERDLEVRQLLQAKATLEKELEEVRRGEEARRAQEAALREEIQALTRKCQDLEGAKEEEEGDAPGGAPEAPEEPRPASCPSQQDSEPSTSEDSPSQPCACSERRRHAAASTLQARWKVYRRQKREAALDEAATVLQAAFRGHLARARLLASPACGPGPPSVPSLPSQSPPSPRPPSPVVQAEGDPRQEAAVTLIQSVFRAHLARVRRSPRGLPAAAARTPAPAALSAPSPPAPPAAPTGQEDSDVSGGDAVEGPAPQPCPAAAPPSSAHWEDVDSDDSDEVIMAPALPAKRSTPLPPALGPRGRAAHEGRLAQEEAARGQALPLGSRFL